MGFIENLITEVNQVKDALVLKLNLLKSQIGTLPSLTTTNKNSLVGAINEVKSTTLASDPRYRRTSLTGASISTVGIYKIVLGTGFGGWLKIRLSGSYSSQNSNGYVEVAGGVGANTSTNIWNNELVCITAIGQTAEVYYIDPVVKIDSAGNKYIEIHKKYSNANALYLDIEFLSNTNISSTYSPYIDSTIATTGVSTLTNKATIFGLKGSNTRMVTVNSLGELESQTIPTNTTYSAGNGIALVGTTFSQTLTVNGSGTFVTGITQTTNGFQINLGTPPNTNTTYTQMTSSTLGLGKLFSDTVQSVTANAVSATTSRTYGVQVNSSGQLVVNVPWSNTTYSAGDGITQTGNTFSMVVNDSGSAGSGMYVSSVTQETGGIKVTYAQLPNGSYTLPTATSTEKGGVELFSDTVQTVAATAVTATASRTYGVQLNSAGQMVVNVPWSNTTYSLMTIAELNAGTVTTARTINASVLNSWGNGKYAMVDGSNTIGGAWNIDGAYAPTLSTNNKQVYQVAGNSIYFGNNELSAIILESLEDVYHSKNGISGKFWTTHNFNPNNYLTSIPTATSTIKGGVELFSDTVQTVAANAVTTTASRTYGVQLNSAGQMVVNVPWTTTTYSLMTIAELSAGSSTTARTINASVLGSFMHNNFIHKEGDNTVDPYSFKLRMYAGSVTGTAQGVAIVANDEAVEDVWNGRFDFSFEERAFYFNSSSNTDGDMEFYIGPTALQFRNYNSYAHINTEVASGAHYMNLPSCGTTSRTLVVGYDVGYDQYYAGTDGMVNLPFGTFGTYNTGAASSFYDINVYDAIVQNYTTNNAITITTSGHGTVSGATITIIANESTAINLRIDTQVRKTNSSGTIVAANTAITIPARHSLILKRVSNIYYSQLIERVAW